MVESIKHEDLMHGSIFVLLKRFVEVNYDHNTWLRLLENSTIERQSYSHTEMYPTWEVNELVSATERLTGVSRNVLLEKFGEFLVPDLLRLYNKHVNPDWRTFDMLLNTETVMHGAVRKENDRTNPPILFVSRVNNNLLIIDYHSKRKMASLAIGIIKGIARHYQENDSIRVIPATDMDSERVQIKVEFYLPVHV